MHIVRAHGKSQILAMKLAIDYHARASLPAPTPDQIQVFHQIVVKALKPELAKPRKQEFPKLPHTAAAFYVDSDEEPWPDAKPGWYLKDMLPPHRNPHDVFAASEILGPFKTEWEALSHRRTEEEDIRIADENYFAKLL